MQARLPEVLVSRQLDLVVWYLRDYPKVSPFGRTVKDDTTDWVEERLSCLVLILGPFIVAVVALVWAAL